MSFLFSPVRRSVSSLSSSSARKFSTTQSSQLARMTIVGRLGNDPEIIDTANGNQIIRYAVGSDSGPRDNRITSWFKVSSFAPADSPAREKTMGLTKGTLVYLEGDASMRPYEDREGNKRVDLSIVQTKVDVLKRPVPRDESSGNSGTGV